MDDPQENSRTYLMQESPEMIEFLRENGFPNAIEIEPGSRPLSEPLPTEDEQSGSNDSQECTTGDRPAQSPTYQPRPASGRFSARVAANDRWREKNPEKIKEYQRKWRERNAIPLKEAHKAYRERNPEKVKEWQKKSRQRRRARNQARNNQLKP